MFFVLQIQPPKVVLKVHLLVNELITFWRNGRKCRDQADTWNPPWCSSGSGYAPQTRETSKHGGENDITTVRSAIRSTKYPDVVVRQPLVGPTSGGYTLSDSTDSYIHTAH